MNIGAFTGRLGHTPKVRKAGDTSVCDVSICVNVWKKGGEVPMWVPCVFWGRAAEILEEFRAKGDEIGVSGDWEPHEWTGKDGTERKELRLVIRGVSGLTLTNGRTRANQEGESGGASQPPATGTTEAAPAEEDIPF